MYGFYFSGHVALIRVGGQFLSSDSTYYYTLSWSAKLHPPRYPPVKYAIGYVGRILVISQCYSNLFLLQAYFFNGITTVQQFERI